MFKVYYDLLEERDRRGIDDVYLLRFEQFLSIPALAALKELNGLKNAEMVWCQEEPKPRCSCPLWNQTGMVLTRMNANIHCPVYAGRAASASPATGLASTHKAQQEALIDDALTIKGN